MPPFEPVGVTALVPPRFIGTGIFDDDDSMRRCISRWNGDLMEDVAVADGMLLS